MGLKDIDIKVSYAGKGGDILKTFMLPSIEVCVRYDRVTSYYTVESLLAISQGIESLFKKRGKMRLIVGVHSIPKEFLDAISKKEYLKNQIAEIRNKLLLGIESLKDSLEKKRLATLAWMIEDGLLTIKAADVIGEGIFHPKTLILTDEKDNKIVAIGSPNETSSGLGGNFEQVMVAKSWEQPEAVTVQENFFESLWNNKLDDTITLDISEITAEIIKQGLGDNYRNNYINKVQNSDDDIIKLSSKMLSNYFVSGDIPALYVHQERAVIDALSRWPVRVLFADEVGLGKTFEVAATMSFMLKYCGIKRVLILTPKSVLNQWQDELKENFKLNVWRYESSIKSYVDSNNHTKFIGSANPIGKGSPDIMLMSAQYARGRGANSNIFSKDGSILPDLLILDEAHSARVSKDISGQRKKTQIYSMLESVSKKIPHLILATATPMQKEPSEYHSLLNLLGLPKAWKKSLVYSKSLDLIGCGDFPSLSDLSNAASMLYTTIDNMAPSLDNLNSEQEQILKELLKLRNEDNTLIASFVQNNWQIIKHLLILLHPAHLLTVRNTRRSLTEMGYKFPIRNLKTLSIQDSMDIEMFYEKVNKYLSEKCFSIEQMLYPDKKISIGFVRVSYQQRVASSLYSCMKSLERRLEKIGNLKNELDKYIKQTGAIPNPTGLGDDDVEDFDDEDFDDNFDVDFSKINIKSLLHTITLESMAIDPLIKRANILLETNRDLKIKESITLASECLSKKEKVLVFSRYTDTVEALLFEFQRQGFDKFYKYGIYTGNQSCIVLNGKKIQCDKNELKRALFSGEISIVFCSDAASEGLNLQAARILINVDVPWTPARLEQRIGRVARLGQTADEVVIYNVWYPNSIEARMYYRIQKRFGNSNLAIGEFPDVIAKKIRDAIMNGEDENLGLNELLNIRNSNQVAALDKLWSVTGDISESESVRERLLSICSLFCKQIGTEDGGRIKIFESSEGVRYNLSAASGMDESISLKSKIFDNFRCSDKSLTVVYDSKHRPLYFIFEKDGTNTILKHSSTLKFVTKEPIENNDILKGYPSMLPDSKRLDLSYVLECALEPAPIYWDK